MKGPRATSFWKQVGLLAAKDLKVFLLDRGSLLFAVVFPFAFVLVFSLVMGPLLAAPDKPLTVYVATAEPPGSLSRQIVDSMTGASNGAAGGLVIEQLDVDEAKDKLSQEKIGAYLLFAEGFSETITRGDAASLTVYYLPGATTDRAAAISVGQAVATRFQAYKILYQAVGELAGGGTVPPWPGASGEAASGGVGSGGTPGDAAGGAPGLAAPPGTEELGVDLTVEKVGDIVPPRATDFLIPGYLTMFVFFALALTAEALVGEKETSTLERLMAGAASRLSIVTGKIAGAFARGLVQVAIFWVAGVLIFDIRMGHQPWAVILISILLALAASGVGVFLATVAKSRKAAASVAVFVSLAFAAFGGSWWPLFVMPQWLQNLAKVTPHAWANSAFNKLMLFGAGAGNVVPEMIALGAFALVFGGLAVWRFTTSD